MAREASHRKIPIYVAVENEVQKMLSKESSAGRGIMHNMFVKTGYAIHRIHEQGPTLDPDAYNFAGNLIAQAQDWIKAKDRELVSITILVDPPTLKAINLASKKHKQPKTGLYAYFDVLGSFFHKGAINAYRLERENKVDKTLRKCLPVINRIKSLADLYADVDDVYLTAEQKNAAWAELQRLSKKTTRTIEGLPISDRRRRERAA